MMHHKYANAHDPKLLFGKPLPLFAHPNSGVLNEFDAACANLMYGNPFMGSPLDIPSMNRMRFLIKFAQTHNTQYYNNTAYGVKLSDEDKKLPSHLTTLSAVEVLAMIRMNEVVDLL